jgi:hypothetical protein
MIDLKRIYIFSLRSTAMSCHYMSSRPLWTYLQGSDNRFNHLPQIKRMVEKMYLRQNVTYGITNLTTELYKNISFMCVRVWKTLTQGQEETLRSVSGQCRSNPVRHTCFELRGVEATISDSNPGLILSPWVFTFRTVMLTLRWICTWILSIHRDESELNKMCLWISTFKRYFL